MRIVSLILLLSISLIHTLFADQAPVNKGPSADIPLIPRKLLFGNPEKTAPQLSPNGKKLAYLAPDQNNVLNVWVRDLKHSHSKDKMVTADTKRGIRSFMWQLDSEHILYTQDQDGDENSHLYQTSIDTKKTRDLTPFEGVKADVLAYKVKFPEEILV